MLNSTAMVRLVKWIITLWRLETIMKQTMNMVKGIGMGMLAGVAVAAVSSKMMSSSHKKVSHMRKNAGKAMHSVGNLIGDVEKMLR